MVCIIGTIVDGRYTELFPNYWTKNHFLLGNGVYVYKDEDLTTEDLYHTKWMMSFIIDLVYIGNDVPLDEVGQK